MDPIISCFQPEQTGPSLDLWSRLWEAQKDLENMELSNKQPSEIIPLSPRIMENNYRNSVMRSNANEELSINSFKRKRDNIAKTSCGFYGNVHQINQDGDTPWYKKNKKYGRGVVKLHQEIQDFYDYIIPTEAEERMRSKVVKKISNVIQSLWPQAKVEVFGSLRTNLYLPTGDIDLVVLGKWDTLPLKTLEQALIDNKIADTLSIKVLDKASVPIVKLTDKETDVKVDISFNMNNGVKSAKLIKEFKEKFPYLAKLVMVLKQFLLQRNLNEVFTGGISSYCLILLIISFLQMRERKLESNKVNLGVLLIEFFELYGKNFNYQKTAIRIKDGGSYVSKEDIYRETGDRPSVLCIEDPLQEGNDIGRSSYGAMAVKRSFEYAYTILTHAAISSNFSILHHFSFLGRIISIHEDVVKYRNWVSNKFEAPPALGIVEIEDSEYNQQSPPSSGTSSSRSSIASDTDSEDHKVSRGNFQYETSWSKPYGHRHTGYNNHSGNHVTSNSRARYNRFNSQNHSGTYNKKKKQYGSHHYTSVGAQNNENSHPQR